GFTCPAASEVNLKTTDVGPAATADPAPFSVAAGDFNGDGNEDFVVTEPGYDSRPGPVQAGIHYYFGDGANTPTFPSNTHLNLNLPNQRIPKVVTTGCFNNDNVVDVATSTNPDRQIGGSSTVQVITSDGSGGFNTELPLTFTETGGVTNLDSIDSAD